MTETIMYDLRALLSLVREHIRQYEEREERIQAIYARGNVVRVGTQEELETYTDADEVWGDADSAAMEAHDLFDGDPDPLPVPEGLWHALLEWGESAEGQKWMAIHLT